MSGILGAEYITVAEAAQALRVSESTVWRWIDRGQLPAYRVGQRKIRLNSAEVARLITPARRRRDQSDAVAELQHEIDRVSRPLTEAEKQHALAVMAETERLENEDPLSDAQSLLDSIDLLHASREERTRQQA